MNAPAALSAADASLAFDADAEMPGFGIEEAMTALDAGEGVVAVGDAGAGQIDVGLMRLCGRDLAVPADSVREVVPLPATLQPSFSGIDISAGSIVIRGRVIPVLDIAGQLGCARDDAGGVVLILRHEEALIGIIMDSVSGLARVARDAIQPFSVNIPEDRRIVSSSFPHGDSLVGLLDPAAVLALPGVPHARELRGSAEASHGGDRSAVVLVTVAGANIALDAGRVVATVPNNQLRPSPAPSSKWVSVVQYLGNEVPVVDDLALFGLSGRASDGPGGAVILLRLDEKRLLGLKIDRIQRILPITEDSIRPLPRALAEQLTLFRGAIVDHEGRQNLLLDGAALVRSDALRMIGALSREKGDAPRSATVGPASKEERQPFLVFAAGDRRRATALASVKQIIPFPQARTGLNREGSGLQGIASYNGAPLPLLDLAGSNAAAPDQRDDAVVLVVEKDGGFNGLVVDRLETLARSVVHRRPGMNGDDAACFFIDATLGGKLEAVTLCDLAEEAIRLA